MSNWSSNLDKCKEEIIRWNDDHDDPLYDRLNDEVRKIECKEIIMETQEHKIFANDLIHVWSKHNKI